MLDPRPAFSGQITYQLDRTFHMLTTPVEGDVSLFV
jgi:hypothetical protein